MENDKFIVRDLRQKDHFTIDDAYLNGYAKTLGAYATLVYLSLCRHANFDTQRAFPSQKLIAEEHAISDRQVRREIEKLEFMKIVAIERNKKNDGTWLNNTYILLDKSQWKSPEDYQSYGYPEDYDDIVQRTTSPHKDSNKIKVTHITDPPSAVSDISLETDEDLLPSYAFTGKAKKTPSQNKAYEEALAYLAKRRSELIGEDFKFTGSRIGDYAALKAIKKLMSNKRAYEIWEEMCESEWWQEKGFGLWDIIKQFKKKGK